MATCPHCGCDPIQYALAQTEIKGHMRVKDDLEHDLECERMKVAGCSTAAIGYWKEGDTLHPEYDCAAIHDVAKLYSKYLEFESRATASEHNFGIEHEELVKAQARIAELEKELTWCADHSGECLGDHMQRLNLIRALLKSRA